MNEILRDCSALSAEIDRAIGSERVAKMKSRLANIDSLISRLDDIESITEILAEDILRLKSE